MPLLNLSLSPVKDVHQSLSLSSFLREVALLPATKVMCQEGGCGACVVAAIIFDAETNQERTIAVNSVSIDIVMCFTLTSFILVLKVCFVKKKKKNSED